MSLDHEAIYEAYKSESNPVVSIDDSAGAFDADGNKVELDDTKIAAARKSLDDAAALVAYKLKRTGADGTTDTIYPELGEQFDLLFKDIAAGTLTTSGNLYTALKATKDKYPKP